MKALTARARSRASRGLARRNYASRAQHGPRTTPGGSASTTSASPPARAEGRGEGFRSRRGLGSRTARRLGSRDVVTALVSPRKSATGSGGASAASVDQAHPSNPASSHSQLLHVQLSRV